LSAFVSGCSGLFPCENAIVSEPMRPGGPYRAVVFLRDCGATTGWSTRVSLLDIKRFSNSEVGNVFVGEGGQPPSPGVSVRWVDRDTLEVSYEPSMQVLHSKSTWEGIGIISVPAR
jgi:hypothetical protein